MISFLIALAALIVGYVVYGAVAQRVFGIDAKRPTPATTQADGVDYVPMPTWKVFLIQFLNIAGLGPIFGAIMGVMYGPAAFLWIVIGTIFAGAVHDFISAMVSMRSGGASLPEVVGEQLGNGVKAVMRVFTVALLVLVAASFVSSPADIVSNMFKGVPTWSDSTLWLIIIFTYYVLATLLPVDKLIGKLYPLFGFTLLFMALGLLCVLLFGDVIIPDGFTDGLYNRHTDADTTPIFPMMFVSIACGAISGFHATQSPMMARCLKNERLARPVFYGAMVAEGIVALIWAAAAIAFTGGYDGLADYMAVKGNGAGTLVNDISIGWLGTVGGILAIIGVVAAPITTGDTALRSARLVTADMFGYRQHTLLRRVLMSLPLFVLTFLVLKVLPFPVLWRYFGWCNQTLAVFTLWACTVYLTRHGRFYLITLIPAMFMTVVSVSFFLVAGVEAGGLGLMDGELRPWGIGCGVLAAFLLLALFLIWKPRRATAPQPNA